MPQIDSIEIKEFVEKNLTSERLKNLFELEETWKDVAFCQSLKNKENGTSLSSLVDKLSSEVIELEREMDYYSASSKRYKYADEAVKEACDVANMAQILMPMTFDLKEQNSVYFPDFRDMLNSILYHNSRYNFVQVIPFDNSRSYSRKDLFDIYAKTVDSMILQQRRKFVSESERTSDTMTRFHKNYLMIHKDMDEYLEQNSFDRMKPQIDMKPKWARLTGDMVTQPLLVLGEIEEATYEKFFSEAIRKMRARDKRYHGLNRLDDRSA